MINHSEQRQGRTSSSGTRRGNFISAFIDSLFKDDIKIKKHRWTQIKSECEGMYSEGLEFEKKNEFDSAESCYIRALNARTFSGGASDIDVVIAHIKLARVLEKKGNMFCAKSHYDA